VIRVVVADDHAVVRKGLAQILSDSEGLELHAAVASGEEAVAAALEGEADVVLMDMSMPGAGGIEATRRIRAERPETQVVVLTAFSDREGVLDALDAGAVGYLLKDVEPSVLVEGIRAAARGESPLAPKAASALLASRADRRPADELTEREREILSLVVAGLANKQIARRLGISEKTVKAHLTRVFRRIGVFDRTQAALWAERHGLGRLSGPAS
jgi:DNA-binding NarL/FixJ family response regulator